MYQSTIQETLTPSYFVEQRINYLDTTIQLLAITEWGAGQILEIDNKGFSFGCLHPHFLPGELLVDILDDKGTFIEKIKVRKVKQQFNQQVGQTTNFKLVVTVEFVNLTPHQADNMDHLLGNL